MMLPGNGSRTGLLEPATLRVVSGSKIIVERREKLPCLKAGSGTVMLVKAAAPFMVVYCMSKKKNVLFFLIGLRWFRRTGSAADSERYVRRSCPRSARRCARTRTECREN